MNCAYHGQNVAVVNCNGCGKPLCPTCDHRIKGFPYCQDCIVLGVDLLRNHYQSNNHVPIVKAQTSPFIAALLSLICPGLGAAYNGQTTKALIHFGVLVGLIQMAILTKMAIFAFGIPGIWLYAALDAWKTAKLIRAGVTTEGAEDFIFQRFSGNPKLWGIVLTALGVLIFARVFFELNLRRLFQGVVPVLLIILGAYLLRSYIFKSKDAKPKWENFSRSNDSPAYVSTAHDASFRTGDLDFQDSFETRARTRSWKNQ